MKQSVQPLSVNSNVSNDLLFNYTVNYQSTQKTQTANRLMVRHKFTPEEDRHLNTLISIHGPKKWDQIALAMPGRTGRQCRDRFHNYLKPTLINGPWTKEEDELLEKKVEEIGQHWNKIAKFFQGRSSNNIKNRWYTYICRHNNAAKAKEKSNQINNDDVNIITNSKSANENADERFVNVATNEKYAERQQKCDFQNISQNKSQQRPLLPSILTTYNMQTSFPVIDIFNIINS